VANGWLVANPTSLLKKPLVLHRPPTDYFNRREFQQILDAAEEYEYGVVGETAGFALSACKRWCC
jgi:hypothetical protein